MAIDARTLPVDLQHIFTYVDNDGTNVNIHAARLREWVLKNARGITVWDVPINRGLARKFLRDNVVDKKRVIALTADHLKEPLLFCKDGTFTEGRPDVFLVDGHHRYCWYAFMGIALAPAWVLERGQWKEYTIEGLPTISQQGLIDMPVLKRDY